MHTKKTELCPELTQVGDTSHMASKITAHNTRAETGEARTLGQLQLRNAAVRERHSSGDGFVV